MFRQPVMSFLMYMAVMGFCGVADHSGIQFTVTQSHVMFSSCGMHEFVRFVIISACAGGGRVSVPMSPCSCVCQFLPRLGLYDTRDHDAHHRYFNVNYAFPFPYMDWIHGTYRQADENDTQSSSNSDKSAHESAAATEQRADVKYRKTTRSSIDAVTGDVLSCT